jgi:hypothetical protein
MPEMHTTNTLLAIIATVLLQPNRTWPKWTGAVPLLILLMPALFSLAQQVKP